MNKICEFIIDSITNDYDEITYYIKQSQQYVVITSNSSIILVPEKSTDSSEYITFNISKQPKQIFQLNNGQLLIICEDGWMCKVSVDNSTIQNIPAAM